MSTTPVSVHVRTRFDGKVFVPEEPLDMPLGTTLEGDARRPLTAKDIQRAKEVAGLQSDFDSVEPENPPAVLRPAKPLANQEEWIAFLNRIEGSWIGPEMEDPDDPLPEEPDF